MTARSPLLSFFAGLLLAGALALLFAPDLTAPDLTAQDFTAQDFTAQELTAQELTAQDRPEPPAAKHDWSRSKHFVDRNPERAKRLAGTTSVEATLAALDYLVEHQSKDGSWSSANPAAACIDPEHRCKNHEAGQVTEGPGVEGFEVGVTALAALAFLGRGNSTLEAENPKYRRALERGVAFLLTQARAGDLSEDPIVGAIGFVEGKHQLSTESWIYNHMIATVALAELLLVTGDRAQFEKPVTDAVDFILRRQAGRSDQKTLYGWRYVGDQQSDSSVTGWAVQALWTARECRASGLIEIDDTRFVEAFEGAARWFDLATSDKGTTGYQVPGDEGSQLMSARREGYSFDKRRNPAMVATALLSQRLMRLKDSKKSKLGWKRISDLDPVFNGTVANSGVSGRVNFYSWFLTSQALVQKGGTPLRKWKSKLEKTLCDAQRTEGCEKGSWDTVGEWCPAGGRNYAAALGALALEAPYRLKRVK